MINQTINFIYGFLQINIDFKLICPDYFSNIVAGEKENFFKDWPTVAKKIIKFAVSQCEKAEQPIRKYKKFKQCPENSLKKSDENSLNVVNFEIDNSESETSADITVIKRMSVNYLNLSKVLAEYKEILNTSK